MLLYVRPATTPTAPTTRIHLVTVSTPPLDTLGAVRADDDWPDSLGAAISSAEYYSPEKQARRTEAYDRALNRLVEVAAGDGSIDPGSVEKHLVTTEVRKTNRQRIPACCGGVAAAPASAA